MPWLLIEGRDGARRRAHLADQTLVIGRADGVDLRLPDPKVSGRHLRLRPLPESGGWVVRDLGSTGGTTLDGKRILRALIEDGSVVQVGETRLRFLLRDPGAQAPAAPAATGRSGHPPLVGGTLDLKPARAAEPSIQTTSAVSEAAAATPAPRAPLDARALRLAVIWFAAGLLALAGVWLALLPLTGKAANKAALGRDLRQVLKSMDLGIEDFEAEVEDFLADHPDLPEREKLRDLVAARRAAEAEHAALQQRLLVLTQDLYGRSDSEARGALIELAASVPQHADLSRQIEFALESLDRRYAASERAALEVLLSTIRSRTAAGDPAGALRRLSAFRSTWPAPAREVLDRVRRVEDETIAAVRKLADTALARAEATPDPTEARRILAEAWRGLEGTPQADRLADELRFTRLPRRGTSGGASDTVPTGRDALDEEPEILVRAAAAEELAQGRRWEEALASFESLTGEVEPGLLKTEWQNRALEMRTILALVEVLGTASGGATPTRVTLTSGKVTVLAADADGVTLRAGGEERRLAWAEVSDDDLLPLLTPSRPAASDRLGLAVLAASLGRRDAFVRIVLPLFEAGQEIAEANGLVARYLHGRATPPAGGYRAYHGEILDETGYQARLRAERIAKLRDEAAGLLARVAKDPAFKKLEKMKSMRATLDERRRHALLAIFNEKHYPYPANKGSAQYQAVQREIDRRVARVREIWDDPYKLKLERKGNVGRALDAWDEALKTLRELEADVARLEAEMAPYVTYMLGEPISIRAFWLNDDERELLAYNRWVMGEYNPSRVARATEAERVQTQVTNAYRMMMGYWVGVVPGPAAFEAIDVDSVLKILDAGRIARWGESQGGGRGPRAPTPARRGGRRSRTDPLDRPEIVTPLRAVRIDDRLVGSARAHSEDMAKRGFFSHHAPPNPATGAAGTSPFDRMQAAGYEGGGASENIAAGASNAEQAHAQWCGSSGHHRNILSPWDDQGVGRSGRHWTQNFGSGGSTPPEIPRAAPAETGEVR